VGGGLLVWSSPSADCRGRQDGRGSEYFKWVNWISCARKLSKLFNKIKEHLINDRNFLNSRSLLGVAIVITVLFGSIIQPFAYAFLECTGIT
jgi:hypothetical protein